MLHDRRDTLPRARGLVGAILVGAAICASAAQAGVAVGDRFPELKLAGTDGVDRPLIEPGDATVIVEFWASWCAPCQFSLPALAALVRQSSGKLRLTLVNVDRNRQRADELLKQVLPDTSDITLLFDAGGGVMARLGAPGMPATYVVEHGIVRHIETGFSDALAKRLKRPAD